MEITLCLPLTTDDCEEYGQLQQKCDIPFAPAVGTMIEAAFSQRLRVREILLHVSGGYKGISVILEPYECESDQEAKSLLEQPPTGWARV